MQQQQFNDYIISNNIIGFFDKPITLKSGRTSHFYVNWRTATNDAYLLDQLTDFIIDFLKMKQLSFETLYGVPEGATKIGVITALKLAKASPQFAKGSHTISQGRALPKQHGNPQDKYFIGSPVGRTIILEDTTTTGGSLIKSIDQLLEAGVEVVGAVGLTDRMEKRDDGLSVAAYIEKQYEGRTIIYSMSQALELLPLAAKSQSPSSACIESLVEEFKQYGVKPLCWG